MIIIILQTFVGARPGNTKLFLYRSSSLTIYVSLCKYLGFLAQQNKAGLFELFIPTDFTVNNVAFLFFASCSLGCLSFQYLALYYSSYHSTDEIILGWV